MNLSQSDGCLMKKSCAQIYNALYVKLFRMQSSKRVRRKERAVPSNSFIVQVLYRALKMNGSAVNSIHKEVTPLCLSR